MVDEPSIANKLFTFSPSPLFNFYETKRTIACLDLKTLKTPMLIVNARLLVRSYLDSRDTLVVKIHIISCYRI